MIVLNLLKPQSEYLLPIQENVNLNMTSITSLDYCNQTSALLDIATPDIINCIIPTTGFTVLVYITGVLMAVEVPGIIMIRHRSLS